MYVHSVDSNWTDTEYLFVTAQTIWEIGCKMKNPVEFTEELEKTELSMFGFSDEFIFEIWGDIGDAKSGRMVKVAQFDEQF